jgi:hypothetical protein
MTDGTDDEAGREPDAPDEAVDAPSDELEDEGIPDLEGPLPSKAATGDAQEGVTPPGDAPLAANEFGTTAAEQARGESLSRRLSEEEPDEPLPDTERREAGQLSEQGDAEADEEAELVATEFAGSAGEPAEEDAVRVVPEDDAPGTSAAADDGYVAEESA